MAEDPLRDARLKAERAKVHINELDTAIRAFLDEDPYRFLVYSDCQTRQVVYYIDSATAPPIILSPIIGDILTNLHSALDYLAYQFWLLSSRVLQEEEVYFPILNGPNHYKTVFPEKTKGFRKCDVDFLSAIKPYKGGNDALWFIKELNNPNKHRLLLTTSVDLGKIDMGRHGERAMEREWGLKFTGKMRAVFKYKEPIYGLKVGDVIRRDAPGIKPDTDQKIFVYDIALNEPKIPKSEPVVVFLRNLSNVVDRILNDASALFL